MNVVGKPTIKWFLWAAVIAPALVKDVVAASDIVSDVQKNLPQSEPRWTNVGSGPLCGVYSTCVALRLLGIESSPTDYFTTEYVASPHGSTPQEIVAIAEHRNATATIVKKMTAFDLRWLEDPLVVNLRSSPFSLQYDHWAVVTYQNGGLMLYDRMLPPSKIEVAELLSIWNGIGVIVSQSNKSSLAPVWLGRLVSLQIGIFAIVVSYAILVRHQKLHTTWRRDTFTLLGLTIVLTAVGMSIFGGDWLHYPAAVRLSTAPYAKQSFRTGSLTELHEAAQNHSALIVDARLPGDFHSGSVRNAVNIPVYASVWEVRNYLERLNRNIPIIVFCQSESCHWDETVGAMLSLLGFRKITICEKGWSEYANEWVVK